MGRLFAVAASLSPALAFAAEGVSIDLRSGVPKQLLGSTLGLAWNLTVFFFLVAMLYEAFGRSPLERRDYAGCVFRTFVVLVLLQFYGAIFGSVFTFTQGIASRVAPDSAHSEFAVKTKEILIKQLVDAGAKVDSPDYGDKAEGVADALLSSVGGHIFDSMMMFFLLIGELAHWLFSTLGSIIAVFFYVLGPLAIVASIPKESGLGGRWFRQFLTYALWPVVSGLILQLALAIGINGAQLQSLSSTAGSMAVSLILIGTALMVPKIASLVVGESAPNLASESFEPVKGAATTVARGALAVKTGGASAAAGAAASTAARR